MTFGYFSGYYFNFKVLKCFAKNYRVTLFRLQHALKHIFPEVLYLTVHFNVILKIS